MSNTIAARAVLILMLLLGVCSLPSWAQSTVQSRPWIVDDSYIEIAGSQNLMGLPQPGNFPFADLEYIGQGADYCHNIMQDRNGDLLFFVMDHRVYDKNGDIIDLFPISGPYISQEALVFPNPNTCDEYFVIISSQGRHTPDLHWMCLNTAGGIPTVVNSGTHNLPSYYRFSSRAARLAATESVEDNSGNQVKTRYIYASVGTQYAQYRLTGDAVDHLDDFGVNDFAGFGGGYYDDDYRTEMEIISVDQGNIKFVLAFPFWSLHGGGGTVNQPAIAFVELDANGFPPAATWNGIWNAHADEVLMARDTDWPKGLEFTPDGGHLIFTATEPPYLRYIEVQNTGNGWMDLNALPEVNILNPRDFANGMIERGRDNRLWIAGDGNRLCPLASLYWHLPQQAWYFINQSIPNLTLPITDGNLGSNLRSDLILLQDQIDGEDYENTDPWNLINPISGITAIGGTNCGQTHTYTTSLTLPGGTSSWLSPVVNTSNPLVGHYTPPANNSGATISFEYTYNGCTYTENLHVSLECGEGGWDHKPGLGKRMESIPEAITLYPNPASTHLTLAGLAGPTPIEIVDMMGRTVFSQVVSTGETFAIDQLDKGVYLVKFLDASAPAATQKLIVQ